MNLRQRLDEIRQLAEKGNDFRFAEAVCNAIGPLMEVVEQQHRALQGVLLQYTMLVNSGDCGNWNPEDDQDVIAARAALSLMDKEES